MPQGGVRGLSVSLSVGWGLTRGGGGGLSSLLYFGSIISFIELLLAKSVNNATMTVIGKYCDAGEFN